MTREMNFGEKAVGVSFNPSGDTVVDHIKSYYAILINELNTLREESDNNEVKRMYSIAITESQTAQMWAVKAATWKY